MLNFNNTNLIDGNLVITKEDGSTTFISEEKSIDNIAIKTMFEEFRSFFPKGKENYKIVDGIAIELTEEEKASLHPIIATQPTELEITQAKLAEATMQINELSTNISTLMDYVATL